MGGWGLLHSTFLPMRKLRLLLVIRLIQDYMTEPVFRPRSLPWYFHGISIITWHSQKRLENTQCHYKAGYDSYTLTWTSDCCLFFVFSSSLLCERIPLMKMSTMQKTLKGKNLMNSFLEEHTYSLSQHSANDQKFSTHPLSNFKNVSVLGGWCSPAPLVLWPSTRAHLEVPGRILGLGLLQEAETLREQRRRHSHPQLLVCGDWTQQWPGDH